MSENEEWSGDATSQDVRQVLKDWIKPHLEDGAAKEAASKATGLAKGTIDSMLYRGRGGIQAWQSLIAHCFNLPPQRWASLVHEVADLMRSDSVLTPGQQTWAKVGALLSDDERIFYAEAALALRALKTRLKEP